MVRIILLSIVLMTMSSLVICYGQAGRPQVEGESRMTEQQMNDPNALNKAGAPVIFDAMEKADLAQVKRLVEAGADIEKQGFGDQTPALVAASARQWDICLYLLDKGADPTVADHSGLTIPYLAFNANTMPSSYQGRYLEDIKDFLVNRHLDALNIVPKRVRELKATGAWPPGGTPVR